MGNLPFQKIKKKKKNKKKPEALFRFFFFQSDTFENYSNCFNFSHTSLKVHFSHLLKVVVRLK